VTGVVAWFTGLPSSGKSTLAAAVAGELRLRGTDAVTLDSDDVRASLVPPLGYDDDARARLYAMLARLAALVARQGHVVLVPATAHRRAFRAEARALAPSFVEIFVDTPLAECARRDTKGLYAARVAQAPGAGIAYEPPEAAEIVVTMDEDRADAAAAIAKALVEMT
jgi:adenylylsulfate kinase